MVPAFIPVDQATERGLENAIYRARCVCVPSLSGFRCIAVCCSFQKLCVQYGVGIPFVCFSFCAACSLFASIAFMSVLCPGFADLVRGGHHVPVQTPSPPSDQIFFFFPGTGTMLCLTVNFGFEVSKQLYMMLVMSVPYTVSRGVPCGPPPLRELHLFVACCCLHHKSAFAKPVCEHPPDVFFFSSTLCIVFIEMHSLKLSIL